MISKETIIQELKLENIPNEEKFEIMDKTADIVLDRVLLRLMNELNESEAMELNELIENDKQDEAAINLYQKFPNLDEIFDEEIKKIREELVKKYAE
ncbi:MAG: hypothetical protein ACOX0B_02995 [Minisyncoccales bacterium]|jgi:hypothetical protein